MPQQRRSKAQQTPEAAIVALRKLPENRICPDCGEKSLYGFGSVVMPFKMFVCDVCKSAHQSYSHRTKSVTMSNWDMAEVTSLGAQQGGGNPRCVATWHGGQAQPPGKPNTTSDLNARKRWVLQCYIERRFFMDAPITAAEPPKPTLPHAPPATAPAGPARQPHAVASPATDLFAFAPEPTPPAVPPAAGGFGDFDSFGAMPAASPAPSSASISAVSGFDAFGATPSAALPAAPPPVQQQHALQQAETAPSAFAFMNSPAVPLPAAPAVAAAPAAAPAATPNATPNATPAAVASSAGSGFDAAGGNQAGACFDPFAGGASVLVASKSAPALPFMGMGQSMMQQGGMGMGGPVLQPNRMMQGGPPMGMRSLSAPGSSGGNSCMSMNASPAAFSISGLMDPLSASGVYGAKGFAQPANQPYDPRQTQGSGVDPFLGLTSVGR